MELLQGREIIFEFRASGASAQVCAVDCATGIEVFVITPSNAMRIDQEKLVLRKLAKALADQGVVTLSPLVPDQSKNANEKSDALLRTPLSSKRGIIV